MWLTSQFLSFPHLTCKAKKQKESQDRVQIRIVAWAWGEDRSEDSEWAKQDMFFHPEL